MEKGVKKVLLTLPIEIDAQDLEAIVKETGREDVVPVICTWVKYYLRNYVNGGFLLTPNEVKSLKKVLGDEAVTSGKAIVDLVLQAKGRADGQYSFPITVDPAYIEPLAEIARVQGITVEHLLSDVANQVITNGWAYEAIPTGYTAHFSRADQATVEAFVGKPKPFGADIAKAIKGGAKE